MALKLLQGLPKVFDCPLEFTAFKFQGGKSGQQPRLLERVLIGFLERLLIYPHGLAIPSLATQRVTHPHLYRYSPLEQGRIVFIKGHYPSHVVQAVAHAQQPFLPAPHRFIGCPAMLAKQQLPARRQYPRRFADDRRRIIGKVQYLV